MQLPKQFSRRMLAVGVFVALSASAAVSGATSDARTSADSINPRAVVNAVHSTLPSVAILGQKRGPSGTTEVFIQVPGVLNMQSVYVLSDMKTVISGVVVPPIENGFPGAQLSLPSGEATVNPRSPRKNLNDVNTVLGTEQGSSALAAHSMPATASAPVPVPGPASFEAGDGAVARASESGADANASDALATRSAPSAETNAAGAAASSSDKQVGGVKSATPSPAEEPLVIETLGDVANSATFGRMVTAVVQHDEDIEHVRAQEDGDGKRQAYLDLVRSLPAVVQGSSDRKIYVMFDPNCPVCHRYYDDVALEVEAGMLEVHWIPAIVFPDKRSSLTASAALLAELMREDGDAGAMLKAVMQEDGYIEAIDGSPGVKRLALYLDSVVKGTAVMTMARAETPLIIFEGKAGELVISPGIPKPGYTSLIKRKTVDAS